MIGRRCCVDEIIPSADWLSLYSVETYHVIGHCCGEC